MHEVKISFIPLIRFYVVSGTESAHLEDGDGILRLDAINENEEEIVLELDFGDDPETLRRIAKILENIAHRIEQNANQKW